MNKIEVRFNMIPPVGPIVIQMIILIFFLFQVITVQGKIVQQHKSFFGLVYIVRFSQKLLFL